MGNVIAAEYVTLDGVMEDPTWTGPYWNDELAKLQSDLLFSSDTLLLGRITYQEFAASWPDMEDEEGDFAVRMNTMPKYVASRTLKQAEWNATLLQGGVPEEVLKLKQQPDQNLLIYGSGTLVSTLMQQELIDQYRLIVYPVIMGKGKRLSEREPTRTDCGSSVRAP